MELGTLKASEVYEKPLSQFYELFEGKLNKEKLPKDKPPINLHEILEVWLKGGYPKPVLSNNEEFYQQWMENYRNTYINRDLAKRFPRLDKIAYRRFLQMLSNLSGSMINKTEIGRAIQVSEKTVTQYMDIAEGTFIFHLLRTYGSSEEKAITKMPKGYMRDTGLLHYLLRLTTIEDLLSHPIVGKSFESFVLEELSKGLQATMTTGWQLSYSRTKNQAEVDIILEGTFGTLPIEVKRGIVNDRRKLASLSSFIQQHNLPFGLLINQSEHPEWVSDTIFQLPAGWL